MLRLPLTSLTSRRTTSKPTARSSLYSVTQRRAECQPQIVCGDESHTVDRSYQAVHVFAKKKGRVVCGLAGRALGDNRIDVPAAYLPVPDEPTAPDTSFFFFFK